MDASLSRVGETLDCRTAMGAVFGAGTLESSLDITPNAFAPIRGDVRPPSACFHLPVGEAPVEAGFGTATDDREEDFA